MKKLVLLLIAPLITLAISSCATYKSGNTLVERPINCIRTRAAMDVGSGEIKLKVAKVNVCKLKIENILLEDKRDVNFKSDLEKSKNKTFSAAIMKQGKEALTELKEKANALKPEEITSVATSAFRDAKNGKSFVEQMNHELGIKLQIIPQKEEGVLGFYAALSKTPDMNIEKSLVWDIGGGSQQMIIQIEKKGRKQLDVYEGKVASVSFRNYLISNVERRSGDTPNPLKANQARSGLAYAQDVARRTVKNEFKTALENNYTVYGIGGVHNYSIKGQLQNANGYSQDDVQKIIDVRIGKTDEELGNGTHVATDTSNPILILGFMKALGIKYVHAVQVNLTDGLLMNDKYWTP